MSTATDEKTEGQTRSARRVPEEKAQAFLDVIRARPAGDLFSVNDVRSRLDDLEIPPAARAGLFYRAVCEELLYPLEVTVRGFAVPLQVPSTGRSAHRARVQLYERSAI